MRVRNVLSSFACGLVVQGAAQDIAPFTTALDHFFVFDAGRFVELEPRKPLQFVVAGDRLVYEDHLGQMKVYSEGQVNLIEERGPFKLLGSDQLAFTKGDRLGLVRSIGPVILSEHAGEVSVSDSLIAWHDSGAIDGSSHPGTLNVSWRNKVYPVAEITAKSERPQWELGRNTFACFDHSARKVLYFYRGQLLELCDSSNVGRVAPGGDIIAYFDDGVQQFRVLDHGVTHVLEEFPPIDFKAGDGVAAYNTAILTFHVYRNGVTSQLLDHMPTQYWVKDSTVVFVDQGMLWTEEDAKAVVVGEFVPEQWSIRRSTIVYLDLNRELRSYRPGSRKALSREPRIERFEHFGNAVLYRNDQGTIKVAWKGKLYEY